MPRGIYKEHVPLYEAGTEKVKIVNELLSEKHAYKKDCQQAQVLAL